MKAELTGFANGWVWVGEKERSQRGLQGLGVELVVARGALYRDGACIIVIIVLFP